MCLLVTQQFKNVTLTDLLCLCFLKSPKMNFYLRLWKEKPGNVLDRVVFKNNQLYTWWVFAGKSKSGSSEAQLHQHGSLWRGSHSLTLHHRTSWASNSNCTSIKCPLLMRHGTLIHHNRMSRHHQHHRPYLSLNNALRARCPRFAARAQRDQAAAG
jgi:hypothetical protein